MKGFSLLQMLAEQPAPQTTPAAQPSAVEPVEYRVYVLESLDQTINIGVPVSNVEAFDAYIESNPEIVASIMDHLQEFNAEVLK